MTHFAAPDVGNYTFGANKLLVAGVDLGNVVQASCSVSVEALSHFSAHYGDDRPDDLILKNINFVIEATLDEPNKDNMFRFFMADATGKVGMGATAAVAVTFEGIKIVGNAYSWAIARAVVRPNGNFGYGDQDWVNFGLTITLLPNYIVPASPWGIITHAGVI